MFVNPDAREMLRAQHRERFFTDVVEPMVHEARTIGIPPREIVDRLERLAREGER
jgi:GntR family transcriptional regulator